MTSKQGNNISIACLLLILLLPNIVESTKFILSIPGLQKKCFYQMLGQAQKFTIETTPRNQPKYQFQIAYSSNGRWQTIYYKMTTLGYERVQVHKLATVATTHSFCIKNIQRQLLNISVKFNTGAQLMDFQLLPDKSDAQNLQKQVRWLQDQKRGLYQTINGIQQLKGSNISTSKILSTKMIVFAALGLIGVLGVNYMFYVEVKKTFKQRKLI